MKTTLIYAAALMAAGTLFAACGNKDEDGDKGASAISGHITVKVDGGSDLDIDSVKLNLGDYVISSAAYANGEFTLEFSSVDDNVNWFFTIAQYMPNGITVSDANVKTPNVEASLSAYKSGSEVGSFHYGTAEWNGGFMYVNGDVNITGTGVNEGVTMTYNVDLKKGWNFVYDKTTENARETTTQTPAGARWLYKNKG
jgi:hypothetical protein